MAFDFPWLDSPRKEAHLKERAERNKRHEQETKQSDAMSRDARSKPFEHETHHWGKGK